MQTVLAQPRRGVPDRREGFAPLSISGAKGIRLAPTEAVRRTLTEGNEECAAFRVWGAEQLQMEKE